MQHTVWLQTWSSVASLFCEFDDKLGIVPALFFQPAVRTTYKTLTFGVFDKHETCR